MNPESPEQENASPSLEGLAPMLYQELRALAYQFFQHERPDHTLQPTALVHEAYVRLAEQEKRHWSTREEFVAAAALMVRRILVDHARKRTAAKRGGGERPASLDEQQVPARERDQRLIALDEALTELAALDPRKSRVVELRYFGGLEETETAELLGVSMRTVRREWRLARAWLRRRIEGGDDDNA